MQRRRLQDQKCTWQPLLSLSMLTSPARARRSRRSAVTDSKPRSGFNSECTTQKSAGGGSAAVCRAGQSCREEFLPVLSEVVPTVEGRLAVESARTWRKAVPCGSIVEITPHTDPMMYAQRIPPSSMQTMHTKYSSVRCGEMSPYLFLDASG